MAKRVFEFLIRKYLIWQETCLFDTYLRRWCKNSSHQATEKFKGLLNYQSMGAVITKCHWLDGLNNGNLFTILEAGSLRSGLGSAEGSFWLADGCLLPVASSGGAGGHAFSCCCSVTKSCTTLCDPRAAACQASLSLTIFWSLPKFMSVELVTPSLLFHLFLKGY